MGLFCLVLLTVLINLHTSVLTGDSVEAVQQDISDLGLEYDVLVHQDQTLTRNSRNTKQKKKKSKNSDKKKSKGQKKGGTKAKKGGASQGKVKKNKQKKDKNSIKKSIRSKKQNTNKKGTTKGEKKKKKNKNEKEKEKKIRKIKKSKNEKNMKTQSNGQIMLRQQPDQCVKDLHKIATYAFNQARNFWRQSGRALAYKNLNNIKFDLASSFTDTYNILVAGIGGDVDNIVCSGISVTGKPPVTPASAKVTAELLMNCQTSIEAACQSPMTTAEEAKAQSCEETCETYKDAYNAALQIPNITPATICVEAPIVNALSPAVQECNVITDIELSARANKNICQEAFKACRRAERASLQIVQECYPKLCTTAAPTAGKMKFQNRIKKFKDFKTFF